MRLLAIAALLGLAGCRSMFPPMMPQLEPEFRREKVSAGSSSCSPNQCRHNIKVGSQSFRVETRTRIVSAKELTGANAAERAAAGLLGWGLRQAGMTTIDDQIVVGTRTVTSEGSGWRLECSIAWLDERERSKDETEHTRITEGLDCEHHAADSSAGQGTWRFRYGVLPTVDSLAAIADTLGFNPRTSRDITPVLRSHGDRAVDYRLAEEPFGRVLGVPRSGGWRVHRSDSTAIGVLRLPPAFSCVGDCALDLGPATNAEAIALRFIAAALMAPMQR